MVAGQAVAEIACAVHHTAQQPASLFADTLATRALAVGVATGFYPFGAVAIVGEGVAAAAKQRRARRFPCRTPVEG